MDRCMLAIFALAALGSVAWASHLDGTGCTNLDWSDWNGRTCSYYEEFPSRRCGAYDAKGNWSPSEGYTSAKDACCACKKEFDPMEEFINDWQEDDAIIGDIKLERDTKEVIGKVLTHAMFKDKVNSVVSKVCGKDCRDGMVSMAMKIVSEVNKESYDATEFKDAIDTLCGDNGCHTTDLTSLGGIQYLDGTQSVCEAGVHGFNQNDSTRNSACISCMSAYEMVHLDTIRQFKTEYAGIGFSGTVMLIPVNAHTYENNSICTCHTTILHDTNFEYGVSSQISANTDARAGDEGFPIHTRVIYTGEGKVQLEITYPGDQLCKVEYTLSSDGDAWFGA